MRKWDLSADPCGKNRGLNVWHEDTANTTKTEGLVQMISLPQRVVFSGSMPIVLQFILLYIPIGFTGLVFIYYTWKS